MRVRKAGRAALLADYYGALLTARQRRLYRLYYEEDYSLAEIAAALGISRQAVHDLLRRTRRLLAGYDARLRLLAADRRLRRDVAAAVRELRPRATTPSSRRALARLAALS